MHNLVQLVADSIPVNNYIYLNSGLHLI